MPRKQRPAARKAAGTAAPDNAARPSKSSHVFLRGTAACLVLIVLFVAYHMHLLNVSFDYRMGG